MTVLPETGDWDTEDRVAEQDSTDGPDARPDAGDRDEDQALMDGLVARLCREVLRDPSLRTLASEQDLMQIVHDAVNALWNESHVKTFIAVLAMRRVRERLGMSMEHDGEDHVWRKERT